MKRFGFKQHIRRDFRWYVKLVHIPFFVVTFFSLALFGLYTNVTRIVFSDTIDVFTHDLRDLALYFRWYDREVSDFLLLVDTVVDAYQHGENIFITQRTTLDQIFLYLKEQKQHLLRVGFKGYEKIFDFLLQGLMYKEDIYDLLGANGERNYIVLLQNTAEKRPNGGFFGSFAFVTIQSGFLHNVEIIDSYYPNWIAPDIKLQAPEWSKRFVPDGTIGFIAANKFGFTSIDGRNIKNLYNHIFNNPQTYEKKKDVIQPGLFERTFNKKVHGVVFLRSDMVTDLLPGLQEKLWEWQFVNANGDLIKQAVMLATGAGTGNFSHKKAMYIDEVNTYFTRHATALGKAFVSQFADLLTQKKLSVYLDDDVYSSAVPLTKTQGSFTTFLRSQGLVTDFSTGMLYFRDSNDANNKADTFVKKIIGLYDSTDRLIATGVNDMVSVSGLPPGIYTVRIKYYLFVPPTYVAFMHTLEQKYGIRMTERELGILALQAAKNYITGEPRRRATRATVYVPQHVQIGEVVGDIDETFPFTPTFANGVFYSMHIDTNDTEKGVRMQVVITK